MTDPELRIPENHAQDILAIATRRYAKTVGCYSATDLIQAGEDVQIPEEFIREAIADVRARDHHQHTNRQQLKIWLQFALSSAAAIVAITAVWGIGTYNALSHAESNVNAAWAQVENQLQRRADLIPQLVRVTQDYADHEQALVSALVASRQQYLDAQTHAEKVEAIATINQAIDDFYDVAHDYPRLQSSQLFINLHYEIAGTENRIAVERMRYIEAAQAYNQRINQIPNSFLATMFGFDDYPNTFEAQE
ncbi:MAG TPA: LemA family protein [Elainellaceae cyanobacterium]